MLAMSRAAGPERPSLEPGLLAAADVIAWRYRNANAPVPRLPGGAILTHQSILLGRRRPWSRDRSLDLLSFDTRLIGTESGSLVLAACRGVGAPATAVTIEELAALGVTRLVTIDIAGSLDPALHSGDVVLVDSAIAGDGTSPHYTSETRVHPEAALTDALATTLTAAGVSFTRGTAWSTDAVYRETASEVQAARNEGALLADMETASVLAVAGSLGVAAAAVLVVADELSGGWRPPSDSGLIQAQLKKLLLVAQAALTP
jgi:uridine phosphorylase